MLFEFDLQMFAEDGESADGADSVAVGETVDDSEPQEEIPDELAGLPEDIARETMAEANGEEYEGETEDVEADNDNKQYQSDLDNQRIPYKRFKQELDKKNELEERNRELEAQLKAFRENSGSQSTTQPAQQDMQEAPKPQPTFNADVVNQINEAAKHQAMQMTGLTQDDLDAFDYMEDDDPRKQSWSTAYEMAKLNVYAGVQQAQIARAQQAKRFLDQHNASVADYNDFARQEMSQPDFKDVVDYATNTYFETGISKVEQPAIAVAYNRIERNVASPGDIALIKRYFTDAKNAYRRTNPAKGNARGNAATKVKQAQAFPRSQNVSGTVDTGATVSEATLEQMLNTRDWKDIPEEYQNILLGIN